MRRMPTDLSVRIQQRLEELGLSMAAWRRASGMAVSDVLLRQMRDGTQSQWTRPKEAAAERGLGWQPGAFERVRAGLEPMVADGDGDTLDISDLPEADRAYLRGIADGLRRR